MVLDSGVFLHSSSSRCQAWVRLYIWLETCELLIFLFREWNAHTQKQKKNKNQNYWKSTQFLKGSVSMRKHPCGKPWSTVALSWYLCGGLNPASHWRDFIGPGNRSEKKTFLPVHICNAYIKMVNSISNFSKLSPRWKGGEREQCLSQRLSEVVERGIVKAALVFFLWQTETY